MRVLKKPEVCPYVGKHPPCRDGLRSGALDSLLRGYKAIVNVINLYSSFSIRNLVSERTIIILVVPSINLLTLIIDSYLIVR